MESNKIVVFMRLLCFCKKNGIDIIEFICLLINEAISFSSSAILVNLVYFLGL